MEIKNIKVKELRAADYNPRIMPAEEMEALRKSIRSFGFVEPVVVNMHPGREYVLIGGHQRKAAAELEGIEEIPCAIVDLDEEAEKALNLALNKIKGKWDEDKLASIIFDIKDSSVIPATGFRENEVSQILDSMLVEPETEALEGDPDPVESESKPGEIYELGTHRLICGDSTDPETYRKLLGDERADMVFTDPPYNVAYKSRGEGLKEGGKESIMNDDLDEAQFDALINGAFYNMFLHARDGASFYICSGWSSYPAFLKAMTAVGFVHSGVIIWVKNTASMGWNDYRYQHEWIVKAKKDGSKKIKAGGILYGWKEGSHDFYGDHGEFDVWEMPRKSVSNYLHPTEKPDWLAMRAIRNSTTRNAIVLDAFGGSGSTMMACEKTGRRARLIELDPKFCDAIRGRWAKYERLKAIRDAKAKN